MCEHPFPFNGLSMAVVLGLDMDVKDMHIFADGDCCRVLLITRSEVMWCVTAGDFDAVVDKGTLDCVLVSPHPRYGTPR